jgi:hypothetical protein
MRQLVTERMVCQLERWSEAISREFNLCVCEMGTKSVERVVRGIHLLVVTCDFLSTLVSVDWRHVFQFFAGMIGQHLYQMPRIWVK